MDWTTNQPKNASNKSNAGISIALKVKWHKIIEYNYSLREEKENPGLIPKVGFFLL